MEFDIQRWKADPAGQWLVKLTDERVHAGTIHAHNETYVDMQCGTDPLRLDVHEIEWIRPLIRASADGWTVVAGFQAEDTTFDTWWSKERTLLRITFSEPIGFEAMDHVIDNPGGPVTPSDGTRARVRAMIGRMVDERKNEAVPPEAHLQ